VAALKRPPCTTVGGDLFVRIARLGSRHDPSDIRIDTGHHWLLAALGLTLGAPLELRLLALLASALLLSFADRRS
jgi:hypothetical protein